MMRVIILIVALFCVVPAFAQTAITAHMLRIYNQGAALPLVTHQLPMSQTSCNQPAYATPTSIVVNPTWVIWDDPTYVGRTCRWTQGTSGPLFVVPIGGPYEATLAAINAAGESPESARSNPFARAVTPSAPKGVRLGK